MDLLTVVLICVGTSTAMATQYQHPTTEEDIASSPVIRHLLDRVDMLERQGVKQSSQMRLLKAEMSQQKVDMKRLYFKLYTKDKIIQTLLSKVEKLTRDETSPSYGKIKPIDTDIKPVYEGNGHTKQKRQTQNRIHPVENIPVAFFATLTHSMMHVHAYEIIVFDHVETNVGNAYSPYSGVFTAPVPGIYVLSTSMASVAYLSENKTININTMAYMAVNKEAKSYLVTDTADYEMGMASQTLVLELKQGDNATIRGFPNHSYNGSPVPSTTTFSGFLLQQIHSSDVTIPVVG